MAPWNTTTAPSLLPRRLEFLEGFARVRRLVHFAFIVRLILMLRHAPDASEPADSVGWRLWKLHKDAAGPLRNAGAFCGELCHDIPAAREANHVADICRRLRSREHTSEYLSEPFMMDGQNFIQIVACGYTPPEFPDRKSTRLNSSHVSV